MARFRGMIAALLIGTGAIAYGAQATGLVESVADGLQRMAVAAAPGASETTGRYDQARITAPTNVTPEVHGTGHPTGIHRALAARSGGLDQPLPPHVARDLRLAQAPDEQRAVKPVGSSRTDRGSSAAPGSTESLTRAIQSELKRVGCFTGEVDGDWGASTRVAMQAFNDRVNAKLPTSRPDYILLTLLQGHSAKACGAQCPPGQAKSDSGTCLPRSVIAENRRRAAPAEGTRADDTAAITTGAAPTVSAGLPAGEASRLASAARIERPAAVEPPPPLSRTEIERQRIAAAEARRQERAAEAATRAEGERLARLAAAENARQAAETRRQEELVRLQERESRRAAKAEESAAKQQSAMLLPTIPDARSLPTQVAPPASETASTPPAPASVAFAPTASQVVAVAPARAARKTTKRRASKPRGARYVGRFEPSPAYRLGRLAPMRITTPVVLSYVARSRRNPQAIFRELQHRMP